MPVTYPFHTSVGVNLTAGDTAVQLVGDTTELCTELAAPAHGFATIYTTARTERVLVTKCGTGVDAGKLIVTRGVEGSNAQAWPAGACFKLEGLIPGEVCSDTLDDPCSFDITGALCLGSGLRWNTSAPGAPCLELEPTGVVASNMCGAVVDETGRFTSIPANWPATCLPIFDPCCPDGAVGGTGGSASTITFAPTGGIITSTFVQGAIDQLEAHVASLSGGGGGLASLTQGSGIVLSGPASAPTISISPTGISAGVYAGFTIGADGRISSYTPVAAAGITVAGTAPIAVAFNGGTQTYTVSVSAASVDDLGVVKLVDAGDASSTATHNLIPGDSVVTFDALEAWKTAHGL